jgi:flagellar biosynthesis component FlhA
VARRVLQFPVRNAFAPRTQDALARDTQDHAHRIVQRVENELARKAERLNASKNEELERARSYGVVIMPQTSRAGKLLNRVRALRSSFSAFASSLFSRQKQQ